MSPQDFCYWLQGYFEIANSNELSKDQVAMIKEHLGLVFNKVTTVPTYPYPWTVPDPPRDQPDYEPIKIICQPSTTICDERSEFRSSMPDLPHIGPVEFPLDYFRSSVIDSDIPPHSC